MAKQRISLGNIGKGITPNITDKVSDGWKQMDNIERDDLLGAIKCRDGLRATSLYTGGTAPGSSIITETISPRPTDLIFPVGATAKFSYYSDWTTTTPTVGFSFIPDKKRYVNAMTFSNFSAPVNWGIENPNSKMTFTFRKAIVEKTKVFIDETLPIPTWKYVWLWTLSDVIATQTYNINTLSTGDTSYTLNFPTNTTIEVGQQYFLQVSFSDLTMPMGGNFSVMYRGCENYNNFSNCYLVGGERIQTYGSNPYHMFGLNADFIGAAVVTGAIDNLVYAEQYKDTLIAVTNSNDKGIVSVSEDHATLKDIVPTDCNAPNEKYGVSVLQKDNTYLMAFMSALMQPSFDTNNIFYYQAGMSKALLVEGIGESVVVSQVSSKQPPLIYQYGIQYVFTGFESAIFDINLAGRNVFTGKNLSYDQLRTYSTFYVSQGSNSGTVNVAWGPDYFNIMQKSIPPFNAPTIKLDIPLKNLISTTAVPTEIRIFRKTAKNGLPVDLDTQPYQLVHTYTVPSYPTIDVIPATYSWTDNVSRIEAGDYFVAQNIPYEPITGVRVYPTPAFLFDYNGRTFALGDRNNKHVVYFSKDSTADFYADNAFTLQLPKEDYFLSAGFELGESAFIASPHSMWRVTETSNTLPYYRIEKVRTLDTTGIIAPKTIVQAQGLTYFLAEEGFMAFNGSTALNISLEINNYIKGINKDYVDATGNKVNPNVTDCYYAPYLAEAVYDDNKNAIYLAIPYGSTNNNTMAFKYNLLTKSWETITIEDFRGFVRGLDNGVTARTDDLIIDITDTNKVDTVYGITEDITATLEINDTVLPDKARIRCIVIYGQGSINFYAYTNRGDVPKVTKLNVSLSLDGTEIPLNILGFEFRYKIEGISSDFMLTTSPKVDIIGSGIKARRDVE